MWKLLSIYSQVALIWLWFGCALIFGGVFRSRSRSQFILFCRGLLPISMKRGQHQVFDAVVMITFWCIWNFQNSIIFVEVNRYKSMLFDDVAYRAFFGLLINVGKPRSFGFLGFIILCLLQFWCNFFFSILPVLIIIIPHCQKKTYWWHFYQIDSGKVKLEWGYWIS